MNESMDTRQFRREFCGGAADLKLPAEKPALKSYHATLPFPPSVNHYWRTFRGRMIISREGRAYRVAVEAYRPVIGTFTGRLTVTIRAWMPDKRRRDLDNCLKSLFDSMTHAGFWTDDSLIDDLRIIRAGVEKPGRVEIFIQEQTP